MEQLFNSGEISSIIYKSGDPKYQIKNLHHPGFAKCQIQKISKQGLILVTGNDDTGYCHIMKRHNPVRVDSFKKDSGILDSPTTFEYGFQPIFHILPIADDVYLTENKVSLDEYSAFEMYVGASNALSTNHNQYRLLLYKFTKIIHTLYPLKSSSKRKYSLNLAWVHDLASWTPHNKNVSITITYKDYDGKLRVSLVIIHDNYLKKCFGHYTLHDSDDSPVARYDLPALPWQEIDHITIRALYRYHFDFNSHGIYSAIKKSLKMHNLL